MDLSNYILKESKDEENVVEKMPKSAENNDCFALKKEIERIRLADKLELEEKIEKINSQLLAQNAIPHLAVKLLGEKLTKLEEEIDTLKKEIAGLEKKIVGQKNETFQKDKTLMERKKTEFDFDFFETRPAASELVKFCEINRINEKAYIELENEYYCSQFVSYQRQNEMALKTGLTPIQVENWFEKRREYANRMRLQWLIKQNE